MLIFEKKLGFFLIPANHCLQVKVHRKCLVLKHSAQQIILNSFAGKKIVAYPKYDSLKFDISLRKERSISPLKKSVLVKV